MTLKNVASREREGRWRLVRQGTYRVYCVVRAARPHSSSNRICAYRAKTGRLARARIREEERRNELVRVQTTAATTRTSTTATTGTGNGYRDGDGNGGSDSGSGGNNDSGSGSGSVAGGDSDSDDDEEDEDNDDDGNSGGSGGGGGDGEDDDRDGAPCWTVEYTVRVSACVGARARLVGSRCCIQDEVRLETFVDSSGGKGKSLHVSSARCSDRAASPSEISEITRAEERDICRAHCA